MAKYTPSSWSLLPSSPPPPLAAAAAAAAKDKYASSEKANTREDELLLHGENADLEGGEEDEDEEERCTSKRTLQNSSRALYRRLIVLCIVNGTILVANILFFFGAASPRTAAAPISTSTSASAINSALELTTGYSPILDSIETRLKPVYLNGTLFPPQHESWSRREPGDRDAEAAWEAFEPLYVFPISREAVLRLGKDPETAVRLPNELFNLGDEAYGASLDVTHKIHCLNGLRKMAFAKYPSGSGATSGESESESETTVTFGDANKLHEASYHHDTHGKLWWYHLRHCVDMLAQDLLCHADAHVHTYTFRDTQAHPMPDFSIQRTCGDVDQILQYQNTKAVNLSLWLGRVRYGKGQDTPLLPIDRLYYDMYGFDESRLFPNGKGFDEYWSEHF